VTAVETYVDLLAFGALVAGFVSAVGVGILVRLTVA